MLADDIWICVGRDEDDECGVLLLLLHRVVIRIEVAIPDACDHLVLWNDLLNIFVYLSSRKSWSCPMSPDVEGQNPSDSESPPCLSDPTVYVCRIEREQSGRGRNLCLVSCSLNSGGEVREDRTGSGWWAASELEDGEEKERQRMDSGRGTTHRLDLNDAAAFLSLF